MNWNFVSGAELNRRCWWGASELLWLDGGDLDGDGEVSCLAVSYRTSIRSDRGNLFSTFHIAYGHYYSDFSWITQQCAVSWVQFQFRIHSNPIHEHNIAKGYRGLIVNYWNCWFYPQRLRKMINFTINSCLCRCDWYYSRIFSPAESYRWLFSDMLCQR